MDHAKKGFLPVLQGVKLSKTQCPTTAEDREKMKGVPYASAIGSIMYAMLCTKPDVCLAISLAGRFESNPGVDHCIAVMNILKYLKRTKDMFLVYGGDKSSSYMVTSMLALTLIRMTLSHKTDKYLY